MQINFCSAAACRQCDYGVYVVLMPMHATFGEKAKNMKRLIIIYSVINRFTVRLVLLELAIINCFVDTSEILINNSTSADCHMADF